MDFPGKNTRVGSHSLLQGFFPTQESNLGILHYRQILYHLSHQGSPTLLSWFFFVFLFFVFFFFFLLHWIFLALYRLSLVAVSKDYSLVAVRRLLILSITSSRYIGSGVVVHGLSCSEACLIFLQKESNACPPPLADRSFTTELPGKSPLLWPLTL